MGINFTEITPTNISISVSFDGYESGVYYSMTVTWEMLNPCRSESENKLYKEVSNKTSYTIEDLDEGSEYNISVNVSNRAGNGIGHTTVYTVETGNEINPFTLHCYYFCFILVPSAAPSGVSAVAGVFNITLRWEQVECAHRNGNITEYEVYLWREGTGVSNFTTNKTIFTFTELLPSITYTFGVAAVNGAGIGVYKNMTATTMPRNTILIL